MMMQELDPEVSMTTNSTRSLQLPAKEKDVFSNESNADLKQVKTIYNIVSVIDSYCIFYCTIIIIIERYVTLLLVYALLFTLFCLTIGITSFSDVSLCHSFLHIYHSFQLPSDFSNQSTTSLDSSVVGSSVRIPTETSKPSTSSSNQHSFQSHLLYYFNAPVVLYLDPSKPSNSRDQTFFPEVRNDFLKPTDQSFEPKQALTLLNLPAAGLPKMLFPESESETVSASLSDSEPRSSSFSDPELQSSSPSDSDLGSSSSADSDIRASSLEIITNSELVNVSGSDLPDLSEMIKKDQEFHRLSFILFRT